MPVTQNNKIHYNYDEIDKLVSNIAMKIRLNSEKYDCILAIANGGLIPARMLQTYLNLPIYTYSLSSYHDDQRQEQVVERQCPDHPSVQISGKRVLVVDEMDDTRTTLTFVLRRLVDWGAQDVGAAVVHNKLRDKSVYSPEVLLQFGAFSYYEGEKVEDKWIVYPWEKELCGLVATGS